MKRRKYEVFNGIFELKPLHIRWLTSKINNTVEKMKKSVDQDAIKKLVEPFHSKVIAITVFITPLEYDKSGLCDCGMDVDAERIFTFQSK